MTPADIAGGLKICRAVGWNQLPRDWELFLKLSPDACLVALDSGGNLVGTVTTLRYQNKFSWVGMLLVDPAWQGKGVGTNLLEQALLMLSGEQTVKLDATPAGREVYLKYDFIEEYPIIRMVLDGSKSPAPTSSLKLISESDVGEVLALDAAVFGASREMVLRWMWSGGQNLSFVARRNKALEGYCFGRPGHSYTHLGPVIALHEGAAQRLVSSVLGTCTDRPIILDVPQDKPHWVTWLRSLGFMDMRPLTRMFKGTNSHPGIPENQFAILGPEFG